MPASFKWFTLALWAWSMSADKNRLTFIPGLHFGLRRFVVCRHARIDQDVRGPSRIFLCFVGSGMTKKNQIRRSPSTKLIGNLFQILYDRAWKRCGNISFLPAYAAKKKEGFAPAAILLRIFLSWEDRDGIVLPGPFGRFYIYTQTPKPIDCPGQFQRSG